MITQFQEHETLCRSPNWRVRLLATIARAMGVLIHIDGMPYGSQRRMRSRGCFDGMESGSVGGLTTKGS